MPGLRWVDITTVLELHESHPVEEPELQPYSRQLPIPEWHYQAVCNTGDTKLDRIFFGDDDPEVRPPITGTEIRRAKMLCSGCPVQEICLIHALTKREEFGIWAGTTGRTRRRIWKLVDTGQESMDQVLANYAAGTYKKYEKLKQPVVLAIDPRVFRRVNGRRACS